MRLRYGLLGHDGRASPALGVDGSAAVEALVAVLSMLLALGQRAKAGARRRAGAGARWRWRHGDASHGKGDLWHGQIFGAGAGEATVACGNGGARVGMAELGSRAVLAVARAQDGDDGVIRIRSGMRTTLYGVPREIEMETEIRVLMPHEIY